MQYAMLWNMRVYLDYTGREYKIRAEAIEAIKNHIRSNNPMIQNPQVYRIAYIERDTEQSNATGIDDGVRNYEEF